MDTNKKDNKCCTDSNVNGEGTSLLTRFLPILDPTHAPIDPYNTQDILVFAKHYADLIRYYDLNDSIDWVNFENGTITGSCNETTSSGQDQQQKRELVKYVPGTKKEIITWKEFFYKDIAVVVASLSRWEKRLPYINKEYNDLRKKTEAVPKEENFRKLFLFIIHYLKRIDRWFERSVEGHPLKAELEVKIKSFLAPALKQLISYDKGMILNVADDLDLVTKYEVFKNEPWNCSFDVIRPDDSIYVGNNLKQKIVYALMYVDDVFNTMYKVYDEITKRSDHYWKQAIENFPLHQPHMALFISFVELFSYAKNELNDLTKRHLEFFYRDVLHLKEKPASPDSVYLIYQLAKGVDEFDLKEGTELTAGKDSLGKQLIYKTDKELVINSAAVKELKTVFLDIGSPIKNIYAAPVANSADGKGEKFKDPETAWPTFGYFEPRKPGDKLTGEKPEIGFAIASQLLYLTGGERTINIQLQVSFPADINITDEIITKVSSSKFKIYFTSEKDWIQPLEVEDIPTTLITFGSDNTVSFKTSLQSQQEPVVAPGKDFKNFDLKTKYPACKIILNPDDGAYDILKTASIISSKIKTEVKGLTNIIIENDDGILDPQKPAYLFTAFPKVGSAFSIGSPDLKDKQLESLTFDGEWIGELDFANRYQRYDFSISSPTLDRKDPANFKCSVELFADKEWKPTNPSLSVNLFNVDSTGKTQNNSLVINIASPLTGKAIASNNYQFARFTLNPLDFGHEIYPVLTAFQLANKLNLNGDPVTDSTTTPKVETAEAESKVKLKTKKESNLVSDALLKLPAGRILFFPLPTPNRIFIPNPPYTPQAKSFSITYISTWTALTPENSQLFHIYPFGETEIFTYELNPGSPLTFNKLLKIEKTASDLIIPTSFLLPQFKFGSDKDVTTSLNTLNALVSANYDEFRKRNYFQLNQYKSLKDQQGNLYIGIEKLVPPQNLSLLFKFADGSAYDNDSEPPIINWSYLVNNEWLHLPQDHIISDSTYGFQTTGIILIDFPADATNTNSILTTGLHWLCASIENNAHKIPKLINVIAQANQATFFDQQNDPVHYDAPLPEKKISKPLVKIPEVKSIDQPFESFDGKPGEQGVQFYQRVSERLRHKGRAITPSDYEHLVLLHFPSIYKVKVLSHTDPECLCRYEEETIESHVNDCCCPQVAPGHVLVIAISNLRNKNAIDPLKPRTGRRTLLKIEEFLKKKVSPFVHVHAKNPKFEEVKVSFNVKFYTGVDKGFYLKQLNQDIIRFLTPWAYDTNFEILFGNKIYASKIIDFIEGLRYVDYITCFRMIHIVDGCCNKDSLEDMTCDEMQTDLSNLKIYSQKELDKLTPAEKDDKEKLEKIKNSFLNEVTALSSQAILVSAKQHCINLIEEESSPDECNCKGDHNKNK